MVSPFQVNDQQTKPALDKTQPALFNSISDKDWQAFNKAKNSAIGEPGKTPPTGEANALTITPLQNQVASYQDLATAASNAVSSDSTSQKTTASNEAVTKLIGLWTAARNDGKPLTDPNTPLKTEFDTKGGKVYDDDMNARLNKLTTDAQSAKPNDATLKSDVANVDKDAQWWTSHEKGNTTTSPVVADMTKETAQMNKALDLINQGKTAEGKALLNTSAADVKDDLNTLQKADWMYRNDKGGGGGGGTGPEKDTQTFSNLEADPWHHNTQDLPVKGKGPGIGGEGHDPQIQTSYKDGVLTYTTTGGKYTDTLISNGKDFNPKDNTFTLNYSMNRDAATAGNAEASENDMVLTDNTGMQAQAASQFKYAGAPKGYAFFQTSDSNGHWQTAALVPAPKPGEYTDVSMTVKLIGNNEYEYTGVAINGKSIALNPDETTFKMHQSNWTHNEVVTQLQEDTNANGGPITEYYKNVSVVAGVT